MLGQAVKLVRARVGDGGEHQVVVLARTELPQGVRPQAPAGQEAAAGVQTPGHVDHKAVWEVHRGAVPGDVGGVGGHMGQGEVLRGEGPCGEGDRWSECVCVCVCL